MTEISKTAQQQLLEPCGLDETQLQGTLDMLLEHNVDSADL